MDQWNGLEGDGDEDEVARDGKVEDGEKKSTTDTDTNTEEEGKKQARKVGRNNQEREEKGGDEDEHDRWEREDKRWKCKEDGCKRTRTKRIGASEGEAKGKGETERIANGTSRRSTFVVDRGRKWTQRWAWSVGSEYVVPSDERFT